MKKIISIVLALVLCMALCVPAMAISGLLETPGTLQPGDWVEYNNFYNYTPQSHRVFHYVVEENGIGSWTAAVYVLYGNGEISRRFPDEVIGFMGVSVISADKVPDAVRALAKNDFPELSSGSVLSKGNIWIIAVVAAVAIGGIAALVIVKKKKKTALASGENKDEE